jgi:hypothetical protein
MAIAERCLRMKDADQSWWSALTISASFMGSVPFQERFRTYQGFPISGVGISMPPSCWELQVFYP